MEGLIKLYLLSAIVASSSIASPIDEALVASAYTQGANIYNTCIVTPPVDPNVIAYCTSVYITYTITLTTVNAPYPMLPSLDSSPYSWSPYDICKYEVAHMVFNSPLQYPYYCPTI